MTAVMLWMHTINAPIGVIGETQGVWYIVRPNSAMLYLGLVNCLYHFGSSVPEFWSIVLFYLMCDIT